ncbi:MAG: alpha/beta fold hydrolase [Actinomycetes bacterium]
MTDLARLEAPGSDPLVVLLHEGAGSSALWSRFLPDLTAGRRVLVVDRRGFGGSPRNASFGPDHFDQAVDDLAQLLAASTTAPAHIVGHSDGASIALLAAARHPELPLSVVAVSAHAYADAQTVAALRALGTPTAWNETVIRRYADQHGADWVDVTGAWLELWTRGALSQWDLRPDLARITCPVLVMHDSADPLSPPEHAQAIAAAVPTATVRWFDTGTHRPHVAEPDRFVREVVSFWTTVEAEPPTTGGT